MHGLIARAARAAFAASVALAPSFAPTTGHAQQAGLGAAVELVDPNVLRVCADPRSMPFSNEAGEGFENKLATLLGAKLGKPVAYTYFPQGPGFFRATLNAFRCDVVMADPVGDDLVQTTNPYYRTSYVLVYPAGGELAGVTGLDDTRLQGKHVGVIAGTPPAFLLVRDNLMANAKSYPRTVDTRYDAPSKTMVDDLLAGRIDAALLWGPIGGYYARQAGDKLAMVPLASQPGVPLDYRIAMGVRRSDQNWKRTLNKLIADNKPEIDQLLHEYGVPLLDEQGNLIGP